MGDWIAMSGEEEKNPMCEPENGKPPNVAMSEGSDQQCYCCPRTKCERIYSLLLSGSLLSILLLVAVIIFLTIGIFFKKEDVCWSDECVRVAGRILGNIDRSVDPCQDFYRFACGGYLKKHYIPKGERSKAIVEDRASGIDGFFIEQLQGKINSEDPEPFQHVQSFYKICLNVSQRNELGFKPVLSVIEENGGMELLGQELNHDNGWVLSEVVTRILAMGTATVVHTEVMNIPGDGIDTMEIIVGPPVDGFLPKIAGALRRNQTKSEDNPGYKALDTMIRTLYSQLIVAKGNETGDAPTVSEERIEAVVDLAMELGTLYLKKVNMSLMVAMATGTVDLPKLTLKELGKDVLPQIDWLHLFTELLRRPAKNAMTVFVVGMEYLKELGNIMKNTTKGVINDFLWLSFTYNNGDGLSQEAFVLIRPDSVHKLDEDIPLDCLSKTFGLFTELMEAVYIRKYMNDGITTKLRINIMIEKVRDAFIQNLRDLEWLDERTRKLSIEKAQSMAKAMIVYPDRLLDVEHLNDLIDKVDLDENNYFSTVISAKRNTKRIKLSRAFEKDYKERFMKPIFVFNAAYVALYNEFGILAAILDTPLYEPSMPSYINYGSIGTIIGHEISHGFDTTGREYDKYGKKRRWWHDKAIKVFDERAQCFTEQYGEMEIYLPSIQQTFKINGSLTLAENIADAGGLRASFKAYKDVVEEEGAGPMLPGFPSSFTREQLYFLSLAQAYCGKWSDERMLEKELKDEHAPKHYRVNGYAMNSVEFASTYHCAAGTPMNPKKKCKLW
ncbi:neprilysin-like [Lineus longissimus]|uniref:neprilysin-like n=1 Tax=Lineus longissimus TaxID=88925 RepID=UPI002B4E3EDB